MLFRSCPNAPSLQIKTPFKLAGTVAVGASGVSSHDEKSNTEAQIAISVLMFFIDIKFSGEKISMTRKGLAVIRTTMDTFPPKVSLLWH